MSEETKLWCIHVIGPDTIIPQPSKEIAEQRAAEKNAFLREMLARDAIPNDPHIECEVIEYPGKPEYHASGLAEHGGNPKDWC